MLTKKDKKDIQAMVDKSLQRERTHNDEKFEQIDRRFEQVDKKFAEERDYFDQKFERFFKRLIAVIPTKREFEDAITNIRQEVKKDINELKDQVAKINLTQIDRILIKFNLR